MIAADLAIDVKTAALLSTAFAFPYALIQPVLGVTGDFFGKTKLMNACVLIMSLAALVCAFASNFSLLVAMRIAAGLVAGGVFPVAMALLGDLVPINQRQIAIARLLGIALTANVLGAAMSGVIGDLFGWRGVFAILGSFSLVVSFLAFWAFRNTTLPKPPPFNRAAVIANFRGIFADPRAKVCFGAVFLEAIFIHGLFPYVGVLLLGIGETRASIAGLLIGCFAIGGIVYSLFVPYLVRSGAGALFDDDRRRRRRIAASLSSRCTCPGRRRSPCSAPSVWASTCCTPASRSMSPTCRTPRAAPRPRCIRPSFYLRPGDRPDHLRLRLCPWRAGADHLVRRCRRSSCVGFACARLLRHKSRA